MALEQRKTRLIEWITEGVSEDEFDRIHKARYQRGYVMGFRSFDAFAMKQVEMVEAMDENRITQFENLMNFVGNVDLMDKETMLTWSMSGFCFDRDGKPVLFHER